jgi:epoxyqueuosine reductase
VDTAPVLEKVAAARAGLGWQGKHTNLIREGMGSWFFLGELLINREVPVGESATDRCGICTDCIDVCPTAAIIAPYVLDARRCISYLTIELRGPIPIEFRKPIGHRIFGCDDCQEVCPWNRFATESPIAELKARPGIRERTLEEWMDMDVETWRATFRRSAVKRAKFVGFKRNVAVALGNTKDEAMVPVLVRAFVREEALVRAHIAWAIGEIGGERARRTLSNFRATEHDPDVLAEIDQASG